MINIKNKGLKNVNFSLALNIGLDQKIKDNYFCLIF